MPDNPDFMVDARYYTEPNSQKLFSKMWQGNGQWASTSYWVKPLSKSFCSKNGQNKTFYDENKKITTVDSQSVSQLSKAEIAKQIGWVSVPNSNYFCKGYYLPTDAKTSEPQPSNKNAPVDIAADQSFLSQTKTSRLAGHVVVTQGQKKITAQQAYLERDPKSYKPSAISVYGGVTFTEPGNLILANSGHLDLPSDVFTLYNVLYRFQYNYLSSVLGGANTTTINQSPQNTTNAWGTAASIQGQTKTEIKVANGTYSVCPPSSETWHIKADQLTLNQETGRGHAHNGWLYLGDVPVFYTPYFSFPIDSRRKTGFLYPSFTYSSTSGYEFDFPFYWNIAPNYDALINPSILTDRGLQLNGQFRYLTADSSGSIHGSFLPNDSEFAAFQSQALTEPQYANSPGLSQLENDSDSRYLISWVDNRTYNENWSSYVYLNYVSDDYYFEDFSDDPAQVTENQILNQADLYYNDEHWSFTTQVQAYQTLHPINQGYVSDQYQELPELSLVGQYPGFYDGLDFTINNQFDDFTINTTDDNMTGSVEPEGMRLNITPDISRPFNRPWGFFKPDLQLSMTAYDLREQIPGEPNEISRVLPVFDVDTGLFFDRETNLLGKDYKQTLEPRFFYLYVPYENQSDIPLFDTSVQPFSFSQLFATNRFTGIDRIGDANQASLALTSRFIDQTTGREKFRASIGQIFYFENRQVSIDSDDLLTSDNQVPLNTPTSPIAGELEYFLNKNWSVTSDVAWDPNYNQTDNANIIFQYKPDDRHIINLGYSYLQGGDYFIPNDGSTTPANSTKNNLNQTDFSVVWPISQHWSFLGRWNYNISHGYPQTYFGGLQYDSCCWSFRALAGRDFNYLDNNNDPQFDKQIYLQVALKTLGSLGGNSSSLLNDIPGYVDHFG